LFREKFKAADVCGLKLLVNRLKLTLHVAFFRQAKPLFDKYIEFISGKHNIVTCLSIYPKKNSKHLLNPTVLTVVKNLFRSLTHLKAVQEEIICTMV